jgi:hypothetical protein
MEKTCFLAAFYSYSKLISNGLTNKQEEKKEGKKSDEQQHHEVQSTALKS